MAHKHVKKCSNKLATISVGKIRLVKMKIANILCRKISGETGFLTHNWWDYMFVLVILG